MPSYESRDGEMVEVPDFVVTESGDLHEPVTRTLIIQPGVTLNVTAKISGTVDIGDGSTLNAQSGVGGTVHVRPGGQVTFHERMGGTLHIARGATATIEPNATALGTINVDGTLINFGTRGVQVHGTGIVDDREGSSVREPDETQEDGTVIYRG